MSTTTICPRLHGLPNAAEAQTLVSRRQDSFAALMKNWDQGALPRHFVPGVRDLAGVMVARPRFDELVP